MGGQNTKTTIGVLFMKRFTLYLIAPFLVLGCQMFSADCAHLEVGLELSAIADKVEVEGASKSSLWSKLTSGAKPKPQLWRGINLVMAFERLGLEVPDIDASARSAYNIREVLNAVDKSICRELVHKKMVEGLNRENFPAFNTLKKRYFDAVPDILHAKYGAEAEPYITEIYRARKAFEAEHNNDLLVMR